MPEEFNNVWNEFKQAAGEEPNDKTTEIFEKTFEVVDEKLLEYEYEGCTATAVFLWQTKTEVPLVLLLILHLFFSNRKQKQKLTKITQGKETRYLQTANVGDSTAFLW